MLNKTFFDKDAQQLAQHLLGKVIRVRYKNCWLSAQIIETEAYYQSDKGSHASLGYTEKRKALFMSAGTIYMYYARGGDSLNVGANGEGNAVLIKSAVPYKDDKTTDAEIQIMRRLNPIKNTRRLRKIEKLCSGQTLVCRSLSLKVPEWDAQQFDKKLFYFEDVSYVPSQIVQARRLGIPAGRDEHLPYRFIDREHITSCTSNPLTKRSYVENQDYWIVS